LRWENDAAKKTAIIKLPTNVSLKKHLTENTEKQEETVKKNDNAIQNEPFTQEDLIRVWKERAEGEEDLTFRHTMLDLLPVLKEDYRIEIEVLNPVQKETLNERTAGLYESLSTQLKNAAIRIEIKAKNDPSEVLPFTDMEKYQYLAEKNPALKSLIKEFNLRLD
jgi:DNA polymerase-3 subunit gamma/tau